MRAGAKWFHVVVPSSLSGALFFLAIPVSMLLNAQSTPRESLLALSKRDHTLAIVDPATLKVIAKIPVGNDPHEVTASTDGTRAYVSNYGFGAFNTLAVVDLKEQKALPAIDLGALRGPHGLTFVGGKAWFTVEAAKAIGSYDPHSNKVDLILGTGQNRTHMIFVSADQKRIITTNVNSGTVSIIDKAAPPPAPANPGGPPLGPGGQILPPGGDWNETVVKVGNGSEGFDVSPEGKQIWVANAKDGTFSVIDLATKSVMATLPVNLQGANRLKFTPDGSRVFSSSLATGDLLVMDAHTQKEIKRINLCHGAAGIQMQPNGSRVFVACSADNYIAAIDLKTLEVSGRIDVGPQPDGMAWATSH
jgi:YVTN family beta-propeller protein